MGLFTEVFNATSDKRINSETATAIEEALHHQYISDESNGIYWVGACQVLSAVRVQTTMPYTGILGLRANQIVYVRYQSDEPDVEIQVLGLDDEEVYGIDKRIWNDKLVDALVLLPNNKVYGSEAEGRAGLAVRKTVNEVRQSELLDQVDEVFPDGE